MDEVCCRPFLFTRSLWFVNCWLLFKVYCCKNLQNHQSETVINNCKKVFSQFGIPKELNMDNGPEFSSHKFRSFSKTWDIHKTISSHHHQSNGLAERFILTVKQTLNNVKFNSEDHFLAILSLNSQTDQNGTSPAKKLFGHKLRIALPLLIPFTKVPPPKSILLPKT